jgi:hypothetical protein
MRANLKMNAARLKMNATRLKILGAAILLASPLVAPGPSSAFANMAPPPSLVARHPTQISGDAAQELKGMLDKSAAGAAGAAETAVLVTCPEKSGAVDYGCKISVVEGAGVSAANVRIDGPTSNVLRGKIEMLIERGRRPKSGTLSFPARASCAADRAGAPECNVALDELVMKPSP